MTTESTNDNTIVVKSKAFAIRCINVYRYLTEEKREFVLSKQLLRCGTSIGANVREAIQAQSRPDFISKLSIALKEAHETEYWLELLTETDYLPINSQQVESLVQECKELNKILIAIIKSSKSSSS